MGYRAKFLGKIFIFKIRELLKHAEMFFELTTISSIKMFRKHQNQYPYMQRRHQFKTGNKNMLKNNTIAFRKKNIKLNALKCLDTIAI